VNAIVLLLSALVAKKPLLGGVEVVHLLRQLGRIVFRV